MSKYNKTVLTQAGLDLAKRANAGQAKFKVTRAVTSADDLGNTPIQQLERMTEIPNIMQEGKILDAEEVESDNAVIGVSLRFTNEGLTTGYKIRIIGLYVQEDGQTNDFLYAVTTAVEPEYMPDYNDNVLYRFNTQLYLVIGRAQNVTVVVDDKTVVSVKKFNNFKEEVDKKIEQAGKVKKARINEGEIVEPDDQGVLNLFVDGDRIQDFPAGVTDFNNLTQTGLYRMPQNVMTIANKPVNDIQVLRNAFLKVINDAGKTNEILQIFVSGFGGQIYVRSHFAQNEVWTAWTKITPSNTLSNDDITNMINSKVDGLNVGQFVKKVNGLSPDSDGNVNVTSTVARGFDVNANATTKMTVENLVGGNQILLDQNAGQDIVNWTKGQLNGKLSNSGGDMAEHSTINWNGAGTVESHDGNIGGLSWAGATDTVSIYGDQDGNNNLDLTFDLGDDGSNHFSFRSKGSEVAGIQSNGHYTGTVDWGNVWGRPDVTPIVNGAADDDLFAFKSNQIRLYPGNGKNCKNLPPASNTQWFTVQYVFENPNGDGVAIFRSPANEVWMVGNNGGSYSTGWTRLANSGDISNLQNIINQQNQTIQSLTTRLTNAENEIRYIKENYIEGRRFPASQEAQAEAWENEKPTRLAMIEK